LLKKHPTGTGRVKNMKEHLKAIFEDIKSGKITFEDFTAWYDIEIEIAEDNGELRGRQLGYSDGYHDGCLEQTQY
jgi:hypothetical protein